MTQNITKSPYLKHGVFFYAFKIYHVTKNGRLLFQVEFENVSFFFVGYIFFF